jgi:thiol-disulfide isomerase/thioredoxin
MGKATRVKRENARERIAAQRAAQRKREIRNRMLLTGGAILGVIVIVVAFILVKTTQNSPSTNTAGADSATGTALPASVIKDITAVPASTLTSVGIGTADPKSVTTVGSAKVLTSGGKPQVLYIGAEYCPYCATERWAMAVALSRFGTFSGLHGIHSSSTDTYPSTPTLTFYKSSYTSKYLTFTPVETQTEKEGTALQKPTSAQNALLAKYDSPPYVASADTGAIPFIDLGGKYFIHGAQYNPQILSGLSWAQVAAALKDPSSAIAKGADGSANMITATICKATNNQPASVCTSPVIKTIEGQG